MQAVAIACSVLFVIVDFTQAQDDISNTLYTKRYERLDIDTILASPRLVTNYVECLLNKKPCAPEGKALKRILPEALRTKCGRCQPSQKEIALKVITALYFDYPQYYKALREKWDPTGEYNNRFEEYLRDQKFNAIGGGIESEAGEQAQRPTRQGPGQGVQADELKPSATTNNDEKDLPEILNRFGNGEDEGGYGYEKPEMKPSSSQAPPVAAALQPSKPQKSPSQPSQATTQKPQQPAAPPSVTSAPSRKPSNNGNNSPNSGSSAKPAHSNNVSGSGSNSASVPLPSQTQTWNHQNHHQQPAVTTTYYLNTQNPVLNIINRITMKFANTAEFIAGMLRGAVPQPQAPIQKDDILRKFCDRLKKTFTVHTNNNNQNKKKHYQRF